MVVPKVDESQGVNCFYTSNRYFKNKPKNGGIMVLKFYDVYKIKINFLHHLKL